MPTIEDTEFEWFWSGNWTVFDLESYFENDCLNYWDEAVGCHPETWIGFYADGVMTQYTDEKERPELTANFVKKYEENPRFLLESLSNYEERMQEMKDMFATLMDCNLEELSNEELAEKLLTSWKELQFLAYIDHFDYASETKLQHLVENWLKTKMSDEKASECLNIITRPQQPSPYAKERAQFFKILDTMKQNSELVSAIQSSDTPDVLDVFDEKQLLLNHLEKYGCMRVVVNAEPWTIDDLWPDIKAFVGDCKPYEVEETRPGDKYDTELVAQANKILDELQPDNDMMALIKGIQRAVYLRCMDNWDQGYTTTQLRPLYEEIAKRLDITYKQFKSFTRNEIADYLRKHETIPQELAEERWKLTAIGYIKGEYVLVWGNEAQELWNIVKGKNHGERITEFKGLAASPGTFTGRARVVETIKDAEIVTKEEVLVTPRASAYFVPHMKHAGAMVTEMGGVTNHAVIVAREQKIPCVANIGQVTKHIRTGDTVTVNGDTGEVYVDE